MIFQYVTRSIPVAITKPLRGLQTMTLPTNVRRSPGIKFGWVNNGQFRSMVSNSFDMLLARSVTRFTRDSKLSDVCVDVVFLDPWPGICAVTYDAVNIPKP